MSIPNKPISNRKALSAALSLVQTGDLTGFAVEASLFTVGELNRFSYHMTQLCMVPTMCGSILVCTKEG